LLKEIKTTGDDKTLNDEFNKIKLKEATADKKDKKDINKKMTKMLSGKVKAPEPLAPID